MGQLMQFPQDAVTLKDGHPVTTSLKVAEVFGKQHKNVLQNINALDCSEEFSRLNFQPATYADAQGKPRPMFEMTKDGFTFLVMGFTGPEAAHYKEDYIRAFNMLLEQRQAPQALPAPAPVVKRSMIKVDEAEYWKMKAELAEMKLKYRTRVNWEDEEIVELIDLHRQGLTPTPIGEKMGRSPASVSTKLRELRDKGMI
ncbi:Rha family transcriptional regulator [Geobacter sp.]|uniref:Rha family transcriptional regulator n=1 Tax=Geobacter sp. TaxID=46610 RepID=UPI0026200F1E|nr:Rha family transcriptional regulator [Geobacter sp.]